MNEMNSEETSEQQMEDDSFDEGDLNSPFEKDISLENFFPMG